MNNKTWWHKPILRTDEEEARKRSVTWLELFFDLVFVVVFERISHEFGSHFTPSGVAPFLLMFFAVFWVWNAAVYYVERFESEGVEIRLFTFLSMLSVTALAVFSHGGMEDNYRGFVGAYLFARVINMIMWTRSGIHVPEFRPISRRFVGGFIVTTAILSASFLFSGGTRLSLFALAVIVDIITPYFTMKHQAKLPRISSSKFPERFGLLTIIVLGATLVELINVFSDSHNLSPELAMKGTLGLFIIFALWALYFDFIARRAPKENVNVTLIWVYLHLLLLATITVIGIALSELIESNHEADHGFRDSSALLLTTGLTIIIIAALEQTLKRDESEQTHPLVSPLLKAIVGIILLLCALIPFESPYTSLILCSMGLIIPNIYGIKVLLSKEQAANE